MVKRTALCLHYPFDGGKMHFRIRAIRARLGSNGGGMVMLELGQNRFSMGSSGWAEGSVSAMNRRTFQAIVMQALQLRPIYREVFILCDIKGYTTSEAAAILSISEAAVMRRLRRARGLMSRQLADS